MSRTLINNCRDTPKNPEQQFALLLAEIPACAEITRVYRSLQP